MRVAFDLGNTVNQCGCGVPLEQPRRPFRARLLGSDSLRKGIVEVAEYGVARGWTIWVYTTSFRRKWYIRLLFWLHGIELAAGINQTRHAREAAVSCTRHPPTFGIGLLIDDAEGVALEGKRYGFAVVVLQPQQEQWAAKVQAALQAPVVADAKSR